MEQTGNYGFSQWDEQDRILREDFNADNLKAEQALAGLAEAQSALAAQIANCGNCKIVYGTYTGNGNFGSGNPNSLTFNLTPIYVVVMPQDQYNNTHALQLHLVKNVPFSIGSPGYSSHTNTASWSGKTVAWYAGSASGQFNNSGSTYHYFALLDTNA